MADPVARIIAEEARAALAPLGVSRKGRSRTWIDDHGWWLVNVEFQPGRNKGSYLNVGVQHLWVVRDHLCFEDHDRPMGGTHMELFDGDEDAFRNRMSVMASVAAEAVLGRRERHGEGVAALRHLCSSSDDLNAGIAAALLGDLAVAKRRLRGAVHPACADQAARYLAALGDAAALRTLATTSVAATRDFLKLPPPGAGHSWW